MTSPSRASFRPRSSALPVWTLDFVADPVRLQVHASLVYPEGHQVDKTQSTHPIKGRDLRALFVSAVTAAEVNDYVLT